MARMIELKCENPHYEQIKQGVKTFEIRKNDRPYEEGAYLILREYVKGPNSGYTMRRMMVQVLHIMFDYQFEGIAQGYCIMSIRVIEKDLAL